MDNKLPPSIIELSPLPSLEASTQPIPFDEIETPDIPASLLPGVFGELARALAQATETPEALSVMTVLGVLSACLAKYFYVSPKEGWQEPVNIYTLIALPPANHKSFVLRTCTLPLIEWEQSQCVQIENSIKRQQSERRNEEKRIESLRAKAAKQLDPETQKHLFQEITELEMALLPPTVMPLLFTNDATPESLAISVHEQGGRFAVFSDEGGIFETLGGLYSNGSANIDILLKGMDGGEMRVRRKDRSFHLNPFLTLVLAVQPVVISNLGEKRAYCGNGALERFLYAIPKSRLGYRTHDKPAVPAAIQKAYQAKIHALLNLIPVNENENSQPRILTLTPPAQQAWRTFQNEIEIKLRPNGSLAMCQGWGGKLCGFSLRIAGLMQIASDPQSTAVTETNMTQAIDMATRLIEHTIAAYGLMGVDETTEDAKATFNWMMAEGKPCFTQSEITYAMRHKKMGKKERLTKALGMLIERNLVSAQQLPTPNKPTMLYQLHPVIFSDV
jgi:hypothetical protein